MHSKSRLFSATIVTAFIFGVSHFSACVKKKEADSEQKGIVSKQPAVAGTLALPEAMSDKLKKPLLSLTAESSTSELELLFHCEGEVKLASDTKPMMRGFALVGEKGKGEAKSKLIAAAFDTSDGSSATGIGDAVVTYEEKVDDSASRGAKGRTFTFQFAPPGKGDQIPAGSEGVKKDLGKILFYFDTVAGLEGYQDPPLVHFVAADGETFFESECPAQKNMMDKNISGIKARVSNKPSENNTR